MELGCFKDLLEQTYVRRFYNRNFRNKHIYLEEMPVPGTSSHPLPPQKKRDVKYQFQIFYIETRVVSSSGSDQCGGIRVSRAAGRWQ